MKKKFGYLLAFVFVIVVAVLGMLLVPATEFSSKAKYIYVKQGKDANSRYCNNLILLNNRPQGHIYICCQYNRNLEEYNTRQV